MLPLSPVELQSQIAARARAARLAQNLTQSGLAERSGVSLGSLRRFERTGQISLESLVKIAWALRAEGDFERLFEPPEFESLDEVLAEKPKRQRGQRK